MKPPTRPDLPALLAKAQGLYFVPTGLLAIVNIRVFEAVTGPKTDRWLVKTVGGLVVAVGAGLWMAGRRRAVTPELATIAVGSAAALAAVDLVYVSKGRISPIYLLDALGEVALLIGWAVAWPHIRAEEDAS